MNRFAVMAPGLMGGGGPYGAPNWGNIGTGVAATGDNSGSAFTAENTKRLTITASGFGLSPGATLSVTPNIAGVDQTPLSVVANGSNISFTHPAGQSLYFKAALNGVPADAGGCTISVAIGATSIDTFDVSLGAP